MWPNPQEIADLGTFREEILNGIVHFLCSANLCEDQKHTSAVAKIYYQKIIYHHQSEETAAKAKKIMDKLLDKSDSSSATDLIIFGIESSASTNLILTWF